MHTTPAGHRPGIAGLLRAVGAALIVLGILGGTLTHLSWLKLGPGLMCQERADMLPQSREGSPYLHLRDAHLAMLPSHLTCTWSIDGEHVTTGARLSPTSDLATGMLLGSGVTAIIVSAGLPARSRAKTSAPTT